MAVGNDRARRVPTAEEAQGARRADTVSAWDVGSVGEDAPADARFHDSCVARQEGSMSDSITFGSVALDCPNAGELAAFYAEITGGKITYRHASWATVRCPGGRIDFQTARAYGPPTWPDAASSMQIHLDFDVDDLDAAEARVLAAGATKYEFQPNGHCRVYADPVGHPFCLSTEDVPEEL
jgi:Glyoxalase-like domain